MMKATAQKRNECDHRDARFHSVQRLGPLPPVELWQCPHCRSTLAAETIGKRPQAAAM